MAAIARLTRSANAAVRRSSMTPSGGRSRIDTSATSEATEQHGHTIRKEIR
jgi:hypothetical protein